MTAPTDPAANPPAPHPALAALAWLAPRWSALAALRGSTIVLKIGGSIQDDPAQLRAIAADAAALALQGAGVVVVHGGGKAISAAMRDAGLQPRFVAGQRYTDDATLAIAERVLVDTVNADLCAMIDEAGAPALGLHSRGTCALFADRAGQPGPSGQPEIDLGHVGLVRSVATLVLRSLAHAGVVPVLAPVALERNPAPGAPGRLNVNADLAAGAVAAALRADRFVLVSDTAGVRRDPADPASTIPTLTRAHTDRLIDAGAIDGGMLPKLRACFMALDAGVRHVSIIDGRHPGAVLRSILEDAPPGTRVVG